MFNKVSHLNRLNETNPFVHHSNFVLSIVRWHATLNASMHLDAPRCAIVLFSELFRFEHQSRTFDTLKSVHLCRGGVHFCDEWIEIKGKRLAKSHLTDCLKNFVQRV